MLFYILLTSLVIGAYCLRNFFTTWYYLYTRKRLHWYLYEIGKKRKNNYFLPILPNKSIPVVTNAEDIKYLHSQRVNKLWRIQELSKSINECGGDKGLFTAEGKEWQRQRGICAKSFNEEFLRTTYNKFYQVGQRAIEWLKKSPHQNLLTFCEKVSLDCICLAILGFDLNSIENESKTSQYFHDLNIGLENLFTSSPLKAILSNSDEKLQEALNHIKGIIMSNIEGDGTFAANFLMNKATEEEVLGNLMTFLFAGHDTTKASLVWTFYCLLQNVEALRKVREEVKLLPVKTPALMAQLKFTTACFYEAIRLYPPAAFNVFQASSPFNYGEINLAKDNIIFLSYLNCHYSEETYPNPKAFNPEQWIYGQQNKTNFFGFGFGPRICPGKSLAKAEASIILGLVCELFDLVKVDNFDYESIQYLNTVIAGPTRIDCRFQSI